MVVPVRLRVIIGLRFPISIGLFSAVDGLTFNWLLFLRTSPCGVRTMYERGVLAVVTVLPVVWCLSVVTQTFVSSGIAGSSRTRWRLSWCNFCFPLNCSLTCLNSRRYGHWGTRLSVVCGSVERMFLPIRSSAGDLPHQGSGVAL